MNARQKWAMEHPDVLGAGAAKRRQLPPKERGAVIANEFKRGTLNSGSGQKVTKPDQMRAIIYHETHPKEKPKGKRTRFYR